MGPPQIVGPGGSRLPAQATATYRPDGSPDSGPTHFAAVTPSDSVLLAGGSFLRVTTAGDLVLKSADGSSTVTVAVTLGEWVPFYSGYVMAATTAAVVLFG